MHYVDGDYNGAQPSTPTRDVHLSDNDIDLMWNLFDYAALSRMQAQSLQMPQQPNPHAYESALPLPRFNLEASAMDNYLAQEDAQENDTQFNTEIGYGASIAGNSHEPSVEDWTLLGEQWLANNYVLSSAFNPRQV